MARLSHPNVVQIFDVGRHRGRFYLVMELVIGRTLEAWLGVRSRGVAEILAMFRQAGAGLAAAHRVGLVHRDFKPGNVLIDHDGVAKVSDFGLARDIVRPTLRSLPAQSQPPRFHIVHTSPSWVLGTPGYMAPEQLTNSGIDARTDQYAFAVALLDALLGQTPSERRTLPSEPAAAVDKALARAGIAPLVRGAITLALRLRPQDRFASMDELLLGLA